MWTETELELGLKWNQNGPKIEIQVGKKQKFGYFLDKIILNTDFWSVYIISSLTHCAPHTKKL